MFSVTIELKQILKTEIDPNLILVCIERSGARGSSTRELMSHFPDHGITAISRAAQKLQAQLKIRSAWTTVPKSTLYAPAHEARYWLKEPEVPGQTSPTVNN